MGVGFLVGLGLAAAGTGLEVAGAKRAQSAENSAVAQELLRQRGYQQQASNVFGQSGGQSTSEQAQKQISDSSQASVGGYQQLQASPLNAQSPSIAAQDPITQARTQALIQQANQAQGKVGGYQQWQTNQQVKNLLAANQLGIIGSNSAASARINPYEVQQAGHAGDTLSGIGKLLGLAGSAVGAGGGLWSGLATTGAGLAGSAFSPDQSTTAVNPYGVSGTGFINTIQGAGLNPYIRYNSNNQPLT